MHTSLSGSPFSTNKHKDSSSQSRYYFNYVKCLIIKHIRVKSMSGTNICNHLSNILSSLRHACSHKSPSKYHREIHEKSEICHKSHHIAQSNTSPINNICIKIRFLWDLFNHKVKSHDKCIT